jgi:hypothetical protein
MNPKALPCCECHLPSTAKHVDSFFFSNKKKLEKLLSAKNITRAEAHS